jgi:hypothetical protein
MLHEFPKFIVTDDGCGTILGMVDTLQSTSAADTVNAQSADIFYAQSPGQRSTQLHRTTKWSALLGNSTDYLQAIAKPGLMTITA